MTTNNLDASRTITKSAEQACGDMSAQSYNAEPFVRRLDYVIGNYSGDLTSPIYYELKGANGQAWTYDEKGIRRDYTIEQFDIGDGRHSFALNVFVEGDDNRDVVFIEWNPATISEKTVTVKSYHGANTPHGLALQNASPKSDVDGDSKPDVINVQTSMHPFTRRDAIHPDGIDYSLTLDAPKTRIEVVHSNIGKKP